MKVRQFFSFFLVLVLVVGVLTVPVMAAENGVVLDFNSFVYDADMCGWVSISEQLYDVPLNSSINCDVYSGFVGADLAFEGSCVFDFVVDSGGSAEKYFFFDDTTLFVVYDSMWACVLFLPEDASLNEYVLRVVCKSSDKDYYGSTLTNVFNWVISWVGTIFSAIVSGSLSGLGGIFAIGISVSALIFAIKSIYSFIWGS